MINYRTGVPETAITNFDPESEAFHDSLAYVRSPTAEQVERAWVCKGMDLSRLLPASFTDDGGVEVARMKAPTVASSFIAERPVTQQWLPMTFPEALALWWQEASAEVNDESGPPSWSSRYGNWLKGWEGWEGGGSPRPSSTPLAWIADFVAIGYPGRKYPWIDGAQRDPNPLTAALHERTWEGVMSQAELIGSVQRNPFVQVGTTTGEYSQFVCTRFSEFGDLVSTPPTLTVQIFRSTSLPISSTPEEWVKRQSELLTKTFSNSKRDIGAVPVPVGGGVTSSLFRISPAKSHRGLNSLHFKDIAKSLGEASAFQEYRVLNLYSSGRKVILSVLTWLNFNPTSPVLIHYVMDAGLEQDFQRIYNEEGSYFVPRDCVQVGGVEDAFQTAQKSLTISALSREVGISEKQGGIVEIKGMKESLGESSALTIQGDFYSIIRSLSPVNLSPRTETSFFQWKGFGPGAREAGISIPTPDVGGILVRILARGARLTSISSQEILDLVFSEILRKDQSGLLYNLLAVSGQNDRAQPKPQPLFGSHFNSRPSMLHLEGSGADPANLTTILVPEELGLTALVSKYGILAAPAGNRPGILKRVLEAEFPEVSGAAILAMALGTLADCASVEPQRGRNHSLLRAKWGVCLPSESMYVSVAGYAGASAPSSRRDSVFLVGPMGGHRSCPIDWVNYRVVAATKLRQKEVDALVEKHFQENPEEEALDISKIIGRPSYFNNLGVPK